MSTAYELAAEVHTKLNGGVESQGFLDSAYDILARGIPAAGIAAVNEISNIPANIGNMFGAEMDATSNKQAIESLDSDLAQYYDDHAMGIDTAGFLIGQIVPGMAGVKVLRAGNMVLKTAVGEGSFGKLTANAFGLKAPMQETYLKTAIEQMGANNAFSMANTEFIKALAVGAGTNAFEGAAWTAAVNATMYSSPILDGRDVSDLAHDVLIGGVLGGVVGGAISGAIATHTVKKALLGIKNELAPFTATGVGGEVAPSLAASDKMLFKLNQVRAIDESAANVSPEWNLAKLAGDTAAKSRTKLLDEVRGLQSELATGDQDMAKLLNGWMSKQDYDKNVADLFDAVKVVRPHAKTEIEGKMNQLFKKFNKTLDMDSPEFLEMQNYKAIYVNVLDGSTDVNAPQFFRLADRLKTGESITVEGNTVRVGSYKKFTVENNPHRPFNIANASLDEVEARYHFYEKSPKWANDPKSIQTIHAEDIPALEKALRDGLDSIKVIPESGIIADATLISGRAAILDTLKVNKYALSDKMMKSGTLVQDLDTIVDKIKHYLGINFNVVDDPTGAKILTNAGKGARYYGFHTQIKGDVQGLKGLKGTVIALEKGSVQGESLRKLVEVMRHEDGHRKFQALLETAGVGRLNYEAMYPQLAAEAKLVSKKARPAHWKANPNAPYLNEMHEKMADSFSWLAFHPESLKHYPAFKNFAGHLIQPLDESVMTSLLQRATTPTMEEISRVVNAHADVLSKVLDDPKDAKKLWMLRDHNRMNVAERGGLHADLYDLPSYLKVVTRKRNIEVDGHLVEGITAIAQRQKLWEQKLTETAADSIAKLLPTSAGKIDTYLPSSAGLNGKPAGVDAGAGFVSSENGNYGTISSFYAYVGQRTHNLIKAVKEKTSELFSSNLTKLAQDKEAAIEMSMLHEKMRGLPQNYFLSENGSMLTYGRVPNAATFASETEFNTAMQAYQTGLEKAASHGWPLEVPIKSSLVQEITAAHVGSNTTRRGIMNKIHNDNGYPDRFQEGVFYPIPRNPKDTPFFAFVIDESPNATGHSKMIYAKDSATLEKMRNEIMSDPEFVGLKVLTKKESENYFKSTGQYEFERSINENYINTAMARKGTSQSMMPVTDPSKVATDFLEWHLARDAATVRSIVEHRYANQFSTLRSAAETATDAAKSKFGYVSNLAFAENAVNTPESNLIKMALDVSKIDEHPLWSGINNFLDTGFSKLTDSIGRVFSKATSTEHLKEVHDIMVKNGYEGSILTPQLYEAMNATVPRGHLTTIVNKANALLATFALRSDPMNALNNAVGSSVLLGTEVKAILGMMAKKDPKAAAEIGKLWSVAVPGTDQFQLSATKMIGKRISDFHQDKAGREWFKQRGFISSITDQYDQTLDHIAIAISKGDSAALQKAMDGVKKFGDTAEKWTGNKLAEEFNRYVAAGVMKDITDQAIKIGAMNADEQLSYINTFVNRTQGNYLAAQRPTVFQGPLGQAMGLFQTYQFNMLQQIFRHVGEGRAKDALLMGGLQMSVYGMNGLPAFQAMNTHIIGTASGNTNHRDLYDAMYSGAGKTAGDWLLYGGLSNGLSAFHPDLKLNLYSRGDVNPRQITLLPVDPSKIPIYQATSRFLGNMYEGMKKVQGGADVFSTFTRGLEQNGVSRPLTGIAQVLEASFRPDGKLVSMNSQGNMLIAHDLASVSSLARMAGAKPLDEAIVNDAMFRFNSYRAHDAEKRKVLGEGIKLSILGGQEPDEEQIAEFSRAYARTGGKQQNFAKFWTQQFKNANVSQAEQLRLKLGTGLPKAMQVIMDDGVSDD